MRVYRMEDRRHHGPFNPNVAGGDIYKALALQEVWSHVPWADASLSGLSAKDTTHPHHIEDVLGLTAREAWEAEYRHHLPIAGKWLVGCKNLPQFYHWFPPRALPGFATLGMELHVYDCPEATVKEGRWQVMFDPAAATLVKSEPLTKPQLLVA